MVVNVIAVLAMPPALLFLLVLANDKDLMGDYRNRLIGNIGGAGVAAILVTAGLGFATTVLFPGLFH